MPMLPSAPEGSRKFYMTLTAVIVAGVVIVTWIVIQPPGVVLGEIVAALVAVATLLGIGTAGNVAEHRTKTAGASESNGTD